MIDNTDHEIVELPGHEPELIAAAAAVAVAVDEDQFETVAMLPSKERNPWIVLISTSLAVFAVFLDTTIGFVAFP
ncbi:MAG: hypothetical protein JWM12_3036, partial [Ilumatobacteraceae bacterium]|nr:hypothetical protein [Ilumatobacteraceae bacterium]